MELDAGIISYTVRYDALPQVQSAGVTEDDFVDEYKAVWRYVLRVKRQHDAVPSAAVLKSRFPELSLPRVRESDFSVMLGQLRQRTKFKRFIMAMQDAAQQCTDFEAVDASIAKLQANLNTLAFRDEKQHIVDLFSPEVKRRMLREIGKRRRGQIIGLPTGLARFDNMAGGLVKQKMVVIIGRTGLGKSWLDLLFVATSVIGGAKFVLYPLEMTLFETAARLYTIFSQRMFGAQRVLKNYDITTGKVTKAKVVRLLNALEDRFAGQLYVADMARLYDPYTPDRIDAEMEIYQPDGFWVDYLTLMRAPGGSARNGDSDWQAVRYLSNGIKSTAMRRNVIGGCSAQVNREALKVRVFLPRIEHISYGDSIGHDADQVFSINRNDKGLWYALVKNRGGPEIGKTRVQTDFNSGLLQEHPEQEEEE